MKDPYTRTATTVSLLNYHFVFCPRYRRRIFDIPAVEERFKMIVSDVCNEFGNSVLAMECHHDHAHLFISALPTQSPASIMKMIKGPTSRIIREEFPVLSRMPSLWTRSYFVSTKGFVSSETIRKYVQSQKTRYD